MNNEPVALMRKTDITEFCEYNMEMAENSNPNYFAKWIPLYTHPVKEQDGCGNCHACLVGVTEHGLPVTFQRMILCPDCGNKRCPKASNHRHQCTESNEPNQRGSIYTHPVTEHFEGEPQAEELHEILQSNSHPVKELSRMDVYELAIESGFMLSTQYGEAEHKLMPVSDGDTLVKLANAILRKAQEK